MAKQLIEVTFVTFFEYDFQEEGASPNLKALEEYCNGYPGDPWEWSDANEVKVTLKEGGPVGGYRPFHNPDGDPPKVA